MKSMKVTIILAIALFTIGTCYAGKTPKWVKKRPTPSNTTFYYLVAEEYGVTRDLAKAKAYQDAKKQVAESLGIATSTSISGSSELNTVESGDAVAKKKDDFEGGSNLNIPMKKACEYIEYLPDGTYHIYQLYQVASAGNIAPQFDTMKCK